MKLIENETEQKLRGGFYTPEIIADFILKWATHGRLDQDILEPSAGDGIFLSRIKENNYKYNSITAIEIDPEEVEKIKSIDLENKTVLNMDFHRFCTSTDLKFDLIIGNPPYIRYQYFNRAQQKEAGLIFERIGLKYSKLTNAWVSFVTGSSLLLKKTGKIGFVLPAEILQVSYSQPLRKFLSVFYNKINIISFKKLVFPRIQQEVVLLLCEKNQTQFHSIEHIEIENLQALESIDFFRLKKIGKRFDVKTSKWTFYFLEQEEIDFLEDIANQNFINKIGDYASVEVGITTGANRFFSVTKATVEKFNLYDYAKPLVGRSVQVNGLTFTTEDWIMNSNSHNMSYLLIFPHLEELKKNKKAFSYFQNGMKMNIHNGYKCRIRNEWHIIPSLWIPDLLFIRRNNIYPRIIKNEACAYTTDTMHRIRLKGSILINAFIASFYNSLSFAFSEISGRSYGGGVLELMPGEVSKIYLPYRESNSELIESLDKMIRKNVDIHKILKITNNFILKEGSGFSNKEIQLSDNIWQKLLYRRLNRSKK